MKLSLNCRLSLDKSQETNAREIAREYKLCDNTARLLVARGIDNFDKVNGFLNFGKDSLSDPYSLSGMDALIERLNLAIANSERILIYGDYDADGLCASHILKSAISRLGGNVSTYIPNRSEGYGINIEYFEQECERISEEESCFPDLILTCDLGIACKEQIEYIQDLGMDVLVSDHHELPAQLPNCVCVNPKIDKERLDFIDFCGAGVALKIAQALLPSEFLDYVDYAAIATIGDSVNLIGENRIIVKLGLEKMNSEPSLPIKKLLESAQARTPYNSYTITYSLVPRINAAGRMGRAQRCVELFDATDNETITKLVCELGEDNALRQKLCDEVFAEAKEDFINEGGNAKIILLCSPSWQVGLLGIIASRLAEEFYRPVILFSEVDGALRGSGRSIESINIYELLKKFDARFLSFGGHSQACGLSIEKDAFVDFKRDLEKYVADNYESDLFIPKIDYDIDLGVDAITIKQVEEFGLLEPFGIGNAKPIVVCDGGDVRFCQMNERYPQHLKCVTDNLEYVYFNGKNKLDLLNSPIRKRIIADYSLNTYNNAERISALVKGVVLDNTDEISSDLLLSNAVMNYNEGADIEEITFDDYLKLLDTDFSVLTVCQTPKSVELASGERISKKCLYEPYAISASTNINRVLVSPISADNLDNYKYIVYFDDFVSNRLCNCHSQKILRIKDAVCLRPQISDFSADRQVLADVYKEIFQLRNLPICSPFDLLGNLIGDSGTHLQKAYAIGVFSELGLIDFSSGRMRIDGNRKFSLEDSTLYRMKNE